MFDRFDRFDRFDTSKSWQISPEGYYVWPVAADTGGDVVTEAYGRSDSDALRLSKDEARLVRLIRDKNIDPSIIIARIQEAE